MSGFVDRLGDLSWLGPNYQDQGWFIVGDAPPEPATSTPEEIAWDTAKQLLKDSDWTMLFDVPMNKETKEKWMNYRKILREIRLQPGFPEEISWPIAPE